MDGGKKREIEQDKYRGKERRVIWVIAVRHFPGVGDCSPRLSSGTSRDITSRSPSRSTANSSSQGLVFFIYVFQQSEYPFLPHRAGHRDTIKMYTPDHI